MTVTLGVDPGKTLKGADPFIVARRFWPRVAVGQPDDCWLWQGEHTSNGYGAVRVFGKRGPRVGAHRVAWALTFGEIGDDLKVCHTCDVRLCVNTHHLFLGTQADNLADMRAKGRGAAPPVGIGERNGQAKLTATDVAEIRALIAAGAVHRHIAQQFKVSPSTVYLIAKGKKWRSS